ncbi:MAG: DEAD/DEAH box helicase [Leptonema sp. (in: Bacteria)]|nr:DEAD/DEAH box helicase [Leptonema sp. (in: bacteria)]
MAIPVVLAGKDASVMAATGTGKTAAYGLPALDYIARNENASMLVMAPTRELANQISDELYKLGKQAGIRSVAIYGGKSYSRQTDLIGKGVQVIVATPGRLLDLLDSGRIKSKDFSPSIVVLDEADEMLDMGFIEDIERIFEYVPNRNQTLLFSATLPAQIQSLMKKFQHRPILLKAAGAGSANLQIDQRFYVLTEEEREPAALRLIETMSPEKCILFCRTKEEADRLTANLLERRFATAPLHGDIDQNRRERTLRDFRTGRISILVATDVAARGLDVADVSHVFNYHLPGNTESYIHRIGRTGRAGKTGIAISFVAPGEMRRFRILRQRVGKIEPAQIPTLADLRQRNNDRLLETLTVEDHKHSRAGTRLISRLVEAGLSYEEIAIRALDLVIRGEVLDGPETIGWSVSRIEEALSRTESGRSERGRGERSSRSRRGERGDRSNRAHSERGERNKRDSRVSGERSLQVEND